MENSLVSCLRWGETHLWMVARFQFGLSMVATSLSMFATGKQQWRRCQPHVGDAIVGGWMMSWAGVDTVSVFVFVYIASCLCTYHQTCKYNTESSLNAVWIITHITLLCSLFNCIRTLIRCYFPFFRVDAARSMECTKSSQTLVKWYVWYTNADYYENGVMFTHANTCCVHWIAHMLHAGAEVISQLLQRIARQFRTNTQSERFCSANGQLRQFASLFRERTTQRIAVAELIHSNTSSVILGGYLHGRSVFVATTRRSTIGIYVWSPSTASQPNDIHAAAAARVGMPVPKDPLSGCVSTWRSGVTD